MADRGLVWFLFHPKGLVLSHRPSVNPPGWIVWQNRASGVHVQIFRGKVATLSGVLLWGCSWWHHVWFKENVPVIRNNSDVSFSSVTWSKQHKYEHRAITQGGSSLSGGHTGTPITPLEELVIHTSTVNTRSDTPPGIQQPRKQSAFYGASKKRQFFKLLQWVFTQRLEYAAHVFYCTHLESSFSEVTEVILFLLSSDSLTCQWRPCEATQAHEKHGEAHGVVDPLWSHKIDLREHNGTLDWQVWRLEMSKHP